MRIVIAVFVTFFSLNSFANLNFFKDRSFHLFVENDFAKYFTNLFFSSENWPTEIEFQERTYKVDYTINEDLSGFILDRLKRYRSDYTSVVVIDNNTGKVLSAIDYDRKQASSGKALAFSSTNPAASVFKVITAADLLEKKEVHADTEFSYNGKSTTLYKYQLKPRQNRWTRTTTLEKAFASSNNVIFGKAALANTDYNSLKDTARKFGFERRLLQMVNVGYSQLQGVDTNYNLAELASGFNRETLISPLHGAVIASIIANDGKQVSNYLVNSVEDVKQDRVVWRPKFSMRRVLTEDAAAELKEMMIRTVTNGTARGPFRPWRARNIASLEIGGKTGSITGGVPYGKRDWFVAYARPAEGEDKGISLCVMVVNVNKWYVKSTYLAKEIIQFYYNKLKTNS